MKPKPGHIKQDIRANEYYFLINAKKNGKSIQKLFIQINDLKTNIDRFFEKNRLNDIKGRKWLLRQGLSEIIL